MLSVILFILKLIGIIILVLLGMLLFVLLAVLFVPFRYKVKVEHGDGFTLEGAFSWLLHFVHARISQCGSNRRIWVRIMGIPVYDSLRPPKKKGKSNIVKTSKDVLSYDDSGKEVTQEDTYSKDIAGESTQEESPVNDNIRNNDINRSDINTDKTDYDKLIKDNIDNENISRDSISSDNISSGSISSDNINYDNINNDNIDSDDMGFFRRIIEAIRRFILKVVNFLKGIKDKLTRFIQKLINIKDKAGLILNFINDENNRRGFRFTYEALKKAIKHILPTKVRSKLVFGTGDPCSTGQILGVFSILYGIYGDKLQITPDFENKVFKGSHYVKGRIRIWTLLIIIIRLLFDKRFKDLRMNYQLLKEAL